MSRKLVSAITVTTLVVAGCGPRMEKPTRICPGKKSVAGALFELRLRSENAVPLKANGQCRLQYYAEGKPHKENFPVKICVNPPVEIYLQGDVAFNPKGIVLGANEREFWLAIKPKEISTYWWGEWNETRSAEKLMINPELVLEALGIAEVGGEGNWSLSNEGAFDVLTKRDEQGRTVKKIHVHSCNYRVWRIEYFESGGEAVATAELYKYKEITRGFCVPTVMKIVRRGEDNREDSVKITLKSVKRAELTEETRRSLFTRPEPRGFKHVKKI
jgi:hypothetical protein